MVDAVVGDLRGAVTDTGMAAAVEGTEGKEVVASGVEHEVVRVAAWGSTWTRSNAL
jgi:hypothetical protein